jgi:hypothetical protein
LGLFGLFAVALLLRLWRLDHQSLWFDEHLTLEGAGHPLDRLFDWLPGAESNKPPLYFVVMHWVAAAFPEITGSVCRAPFLVQPLAHFQWS